MLRAGEVISKTELSERLYEEELERESNVIEVFMGRLRRKLDPEDTLKPIETVARPGLSLRHAAQLRLTRAPCIPSAGGCCFRFPSRSSRSSA